MKMTLLLRLSAAVFLLLVVNAALWFCMFVLNLL